MNNLYFAKIEKYSQIMSKVLIKITKCGVLRSAVAKNKGYGVL
jgi:hypothetical protein